MATHVCTQRGCRYESPKKQMVCPVCNNPQYDYGEEVDRELLVDFMDASDMVDVMPPDDYDQSTEYVTETKPKTKPKK